MYYVYINSVDSTVPINPKILIQTWDGVRAGDRLLTMACSDKIREQPGSRKARLFPDPALALHPS